MSKKFCAMKKILFLSLVVVALSSCGKEPDKGQLDPNATVLIKPDKGVQLRSTVSGSTALQIVQTTMNVDFRSHWFSNVYSEENKFLSRGFADSQRDLTIPALKMWGTDIISQDGEFMKDFIYGTDFYLTNYDNDTIGYIPQEVINNARIQIEKAYNDGNYTEVYRLFDNAFTFRSIE